MDYLPFVRTAKLAGANLPIRKVILVDLNILDACLETQDKIKENEGIDKEGICHMQEKKLIQL